MVELVWRTVIFHEALLVCYPDLSATVLRTILQTNMLHEYYCVGGIVPF